ncbi:MAG TPA: aldehyde dehydrogenase family protein, partial [Burkholderiaceae bacterium]
MLAIANPANGHVIAELPTDDAGSIAAKVGRARAAQPAWAGTPLPQRLAAIRRFRDSLAREVDRLAAVLTSEVGKPLRQARNEINGVLGRIDFFLEQTAGTVAARVVHDEAGVRERITHEPLGVVANISAWNYPYFVGGNVFLPALLTGNAVLYKPSELSTL